MDGFSVDVSALRRSAAALGAAADGVRDLGQVDGVWDVVSALPAAETPVACLGLARRLTAWAQAYAARVDALASRVDDSVAGFVDVDEVVAARLTAAAGPW